MRLRIFIREGRFVDVEAPGGRAPRAEIGALLEAREGSFDFDVAPVDREDRVQASMTQLLLDVARETDESKRDVVA
jgi:hypothetical protein